MRYLIFSGIIVLGTLAGCAEIPAPPQKSVTTALPSAVVTAPHLGSTRYQVHFDDNSAQLSERAQKTVDTVAYTATNNRATRVTVIGKMDRGGNSAANLELSQFRAARIRGALITAGVPSSRIDTAWGGVARKDVAADSEVRGQRDQVVDVTVIEQLP